MGTYNIDFSEIVEDMRNFLENIEGDFTAEDIARAYNVVAEEEGWEDKLKW